MPSWPASLPQVPEVAGFSVDDPDVLARDQPSVGPPLTRRRVTDTVRPVTCSVTLSSRALKDTLSSFFLSDCLGGSLTVTWAKLAEHTGGGTPNFLFSTPPQYSPLGGGRWRAQLQFLRLP